MKLALTSLAQEKIAYYFAQSQKYLAAVSVDDARKAELRRYAERLMARKY